jgi:hypothetical protein
MTFGTVSRAAAVTPIQGGVGDYVTMFSQSGDWVGGGADRVYDSANASISLSGTQYDLNVRVSGGTYGDEFDLEFASPPGEALHEGLYLRAQRAPFRESGRPGIDVSGDGRGCNEVGGRFDVKRVTFTPDGAPESLWLSYEQHCENGLPALFGEVRVGLPAPSSALVSAPRGIWWPDLDGGAKGKTVPITILNATQAEVGVAGTDIRGRNNGAFEIRLDECSGTTLFAGDSCNVFVRFVPRAPGPRVARLIITDDSAMRHSVSLDGYRIPGRTRFVMHSDDGDWIGGGRDYSYNPRNASIGAGGDRRYAYMGVDGNDGNWWTAEFVAPKDDILAPGTTYDGALRYPFNNGAPGMDVSGSGRGCNTLTGKFTVTALRVAADGMPRYFGIDFEQHCEGGTPALRGTVEWRLPVGDTAPPGRVSDVSITRQTDHATVSWNNPTDPDYAFTIVRFLHSTHAPGLPNSALLAYAGDGTSAQIAGTPAMGPVAVSIFTVDSAGNVSGGVVAVSNPIL